MSKAPKPTPRDPRLWWLLLLPALPVLGALLGLGVVGAILLVVFWLLGAWALTLRGMLGGPVGPELRLESIGASHFVEKVRWALDRLGLEYEESVWAGSLGAFYLGRTVPRLHVRTGAVISRIGNSPEILRYLWGRYGESLGERAEFLRPTAERVELEARLDAYGVELQRWVYFHILPDREASLRAWGVRDQRIPRWQRVVIRGLFPIHRALMRRAFRITDGSYARSTESIEALLGEMEDRLTKGAHLLGGEAPDYTDFAFASLSSIWMMPEHFAGGGEGARILRPDERPAGMVAAADRWKDRFPKSVAHIEALYARHR